MAHAQEVPAQTLCPYMGSGLEMKAVWGDLFQECHAEYSKQEIKF